MHLRYANDCVLSHQVPITGTHLFLGMGKSRPQHIGAGKIDGLPGASAAELLVTLSSTWVYHE